MKNGTDLSMMGGPGTVLKHRPGQLKRPEGRSPVPDQTVPACAPVLNAVEYRDVEGWPGYRVGRDGSVWSRNSVNYPGKWRRLVGGVNKYGYHKVILCRGKERRHVLACVLVLEAFIGPRPEGLVACHGPKGCADDSADNLRWGTQASNIADKERDGTKLFGERHPQAKLNEEKVREIRRRRSAGATYKVLAGAFLMSRPTIAEVCTRKIWRHVSD